MEEARYKSEAATAIPIPSTATKEESVGPTSPSGPRLGSAPASPKHGTAKVVPATPKAKVGKLDLNVLPWVDVYLGDKKLGRTPIQGFQLPVGLHSLTLVNPDLRSRRPIQVRIREQKTTSQVVDLR